MIKSIFLSLLATTAVSAIADAQIAVPLPDRAIVKLLPDYARPKVYALNRGNGTTPGTLLSLNATNGAVLGEIALGLSPTDMAISPAAEALYVINTGARTLMKVSLAAFAVTGTRSFTTPNTYDVNNPLHIAVGPSDIVYFTDGGWSPGVYTYDFLRGTNVSLWDDDNGVGGLAVTRNGSTMYTWRQYGWGAGVLNSWVARFTLSGGVLTPQETSPGAWRDPFDTPVLLNGAETLVFAKQQMLAATNVGLLLQTFPENLYAISLDGAVAFGNTKLFNTRNGLTLTNFAFSSTVQSLSGDQRSLFRYRSDVSELFVYDMSQLASVSGPTPQPTPADDAVVALAPTTLNWTPSPVALSYRVFFGANAPQVAAASTSSPEYVGSVSSTSIPLNRSMSPGATYYWRVDRIGFSDTSVGAVWSFTVAPLAVIPQRLDVSGIAAYNPAPSILTLTSAVPRAWSAAVRGGTWTSLSSTSGSTPANISVSFTTTNLPVGEFNIIDITCAGITAPIVVTLDVRPLNIVKMLTDHQRPYIYALQPPPLAGQSGRLLFINSLTESIEQALPIGDNPTDAAIHYAENRLYIANWGRDETYVVDLNTRSLLPSLRLGADVYKINAGRAGRIYTEGFDQWIMISIIDTASGQTVGTLPWPERQGDGEVSPRGDAYYHCDDNISNAHIHKHSLVGDVATEIGYSAEHPYGSRNLILSPDGTRLFWRGYMYDTELSGPATNYMAELAYLGGEIYATTTHGELAFTATSVLNTRNGQTFYNLPVGSTIIAVSGDQQKVFLYDVGQQRLQVIPMSQIAPVPSPGLVPTPAHDSMVGLPLAQLSWTVSPFALGYRVFFGTDATAVATATTNSPLFAGMITTTSIPTPVSLQYGATYYWRVDSVGFNSTSTGSVWRFTTAPISVSPQSLSIKGVAGLPILPVTLNVSAPTPTGWTVLPEQSWLSVNTPSGTTPSTLTVSFDTGGLSNGVHTSALNFTAGGMALRVPVSLELFDLEATHMLADRDRPYIYVLHRGSGNYDDAFLLFLNTDTGVVEKVLPIGRNPTDMSINRGENRLYVVNMGTSSLRVVDLVTRTLLPPLPVYASVDRVNAGRPGRVVLEEWNQWINAYLIDTTNNGAIIGTAFFREGDGEFDPTGRYYYHSDNNISGAGMTKYDLNNSTFVSVGAVGGYYYYGSRHIVVSLDGSRIFWTGAAYDANLGVIGNIGAEIYSCSTNGAVAFSADRAFETATRQAIFSLPVATTVSAVDRRDERLWYFNPVLKRIQSVSMNIVRAPTITQSPTGSTVPSGGSVNMTVAAIGLSPLSYQWWRQGTNLIGQTNFFLSFANAQPEQSGEYQVVVSNSYGSVTSAVAQLTVLVAPSIAQQPSGMSLPAGSTAVFTVQATGTAPLRYQWSFEGVNLAGTTNATLALSNVQAAHAGAYRVQVSNSAGSLLSASAILRVIPAAPSIVSDLANKTVSAGSDAVFTVIAAGSAPFVYRWYFGGAQIAGANGPTLVVMNAQAVHQGSYSVTVSNNLGVASSAVATLIVTPRAPMFVIDPQGATMPAGTNSFTLNALARGSEPISYAWLLNGTYLPSQVGSSLVLANVSPAQSGRYSAVASNAVGMSTSLVAEVTIIGAPPVVVRDPVSLNAAAGSTFTLTSQASGSEPLAYQWRRQGTNLPGQTSWILTISNAAPGDAAMYYAVVSNAFGVATSATATVTVIVSPTFVVTLTNRAVDIGADVTLSVMAESSSPLTFSWQFNGSPLPSTNSSLFLPNVQRARAGVYRVTVANQYGSATARMNLTVFPRAGNVVAWGDDSGGQITVPGNLPAVAGVAGGDFHSLALRRDGSVVAWGYDGDGQASPPPLSNIVAIAAGASHNLAVGLNGAITAWGRNDYGQTLVPGGATSIVAVAAGEAHSVAIRQDGGVVVWGDNSLGQRSLPGGTGSITAAAAGRNHTIALRNNGTVVAWGMNSHGQCNVPANLSGIQAVAAGYLHSLALRNDGTVVAWGDNTYGQCSVPAGLSNVIAVAAGELHSIALTADGHVVAWGDNAFAQSAGPGSLAVASAIASGYYHGLGIVPPMLRLGTYQGKMELWWTGNYMLQQSSSVTGPFEDLMQTSPCTNWWSPEAGARFFRLRSLP